MTTSELAPLRNLVEGTANALANIYDQHAGAPAPRSIASQHSRAALPDRLRDPPFSNDLVYDAQGSISVTLLATVDHLRALHRAMAPDPKPLIWSMQSITRTVVELSARAWWLCDDVDGAPGIADRFAASSLNALSESERLAVAAAHPSIADSDAERRKESLGRNVARIRTWCRDADVPEWPGGTALCGQMMRGGRVVYGYLSQPGHGTLSGLLSRVSLGEDDAGQVVVTGEDLIRYGACALDAVSTAADRVLHYFGWHVETWRSWRFHVYKRVAQLLGIIDSNGQLIDGGAATTGHARDGT